MKAMVSILVLFVSIQSVFAQTDTSSSLSSDSAYALLHEQNQVLVESSIIEMMRRECGKFYRIKNIEACLQKSVEPLFLPFVKELAKKVYSTDSQYTASQLISDDGFNRILEKARSELTWVPAEAELSKETFCSTSNDVFIRAYVSERAPTWTVTDATLGAYFGGKWLRSGYAVGGQVMHGYKVLMEDNRFVTINFRSHYDRRFQEYCWYGNFDCEMLSYGKVKATDPMLGYVFVRDRSHDGDISVMHAELNYIRKEVGCP